MRTRNWSAGEWPSASASGKRVLIESDDGAIQCAYGNILRDAGYDVATCGGPDENGGPCPLAARGECELAAKADVVVNAFRLAPAANRDVLAALAEHHPTTPVIVECGSQHHDAYAGEIPDWLPAPVTQRALLVKVRDVVDAGHRPATAITNDD